MNLLKKYKVTFLSILIFILAIILYKTFFSSLITVSTQSAEAQSVGSDLVTLYQNLQKVSLDQSLFSSPAYRSLIDYSVPLFQQPTGRTNPFDLIGR